MDEPKPATSLEPTPTNEAKTVVPIVADPEALARGSGHITRVPDVPVLSRARTEDSVMEGLPQAKVERIAAMRRDLADLQRQLTEAQQRIATELQGRADDAERFETLEEELRLEIAARDEQLAMKAAALTEARSVLETRDVELGTVRAERDSLKRESDIVRANARDIGNRIIQFGQGLLEGREGEPIAAIVRPQPPPVPRPKPPAPVEPQPVEAILEVIEEPKPHAARGWLMLLGGAIVGCAATFAVVKVTSTDTTDATQPVASAAAPETREATPPPSAPATPSQVDVPIAAPGIAAAAPETTAPAATFGTTPAAAPATTTATAPATTSTEGTLVLPASASGHRLFVDDRVVEVKDGRVAIACGSHQVRIGSHGTVRTLDVTCGQETPIPADD